MGVWGGSGGRHVEDPQRGSGPQNAGVECARILDQATFKMEERTTCSEDAARAPQTPPFVPSLSSEARAGARQSAWRAGKVARTMPRSLTNPTNFTKKTPNLRHILGESRQGSLLPLSWQGSRVPRTAWRVCDGAALNASDNAGRRIDAPRSPQDAWVLA